MFQKAIWKERHQDLCYQQGGFDHLWPRGQAPCTLPWGSGHPEWPRVFVISLPWKPFAMVDSITFGHHHLRHLSAWHCCKWPNPKRCQRARTGDSPAKHVDPCGLWLFNLIQDPQIYAKSFCFRKINKGHLVLQLTLFLDFETSDFLKQIWVGNKDCPIDASGQTRLIQKLAFLQDFNKLVPSSDPVAGFQPSNSSYFIRFFRIQHLAGLSTQRFHRNLANPHLSSNKISPP